MYDLINNNELKDRHGSVELVLGMMIICLGIAFSGADAAEPNHVTTAVQEPTTQAGEPDLVDGRLTMVAFNKDCPLQDALSVLAANFGKNIVPSAQVNGTLGFSKLRDISFDEAMDAVLGADFVYEYEGQIIKVYSKDEYRKIQADVERMKHQVFTLYYISAAEAMNLIEPIQSGAGMVKASTPADTVLPTGESISAGANGGDSSAANDKIIVLDYPERLVEIAALLEELDVRPRQVLVEATILSATLTENTQFGVDWKSIDGMSVSKTVSGLMTSGFAGSGGMTIGISSDHADMLIEALETITDTTLLANPKIMAVNKQLGQVYIGKKLGYRTGASVGSGGVVTEGEVKFLDTGTKLTFRPYIGNDGYIRMDIHPKDSTGNLNVEGVPDETSTELATNIIVKDGETVVIGGLFRTVLTKGTSQVPVLGNIPLMGSLFRSTNDKEERQEVIVMLTPHILDKINPAVGDYAKSDVNRKRQAAKDSFETFSLSKMADRHYTEACRLYINGYSDWALKQVKAALRIRPSYLEAIRLKERILSETDLEQFEMLGRNAEEQIERQEMARIHK